MEHPFEKTGATVPRELMRTFVILDTWIPGFLVLLSLSVVRLLANNPKARSCDHHGFFGKMTRLTIQPFGAGQLNLAESSPLFARGVRRQAPVGF